MTHAVSTKPKDALANLEKVVIMGDLTGLTQEERIGYYARVCESLGINPLTRPFEYIELNRKLTLYARKDATDQLRKVNGISVTGIRRERDAELELQIVTVEGQDRDGRTDSSIGAVSIKGLQGELLANALMKAETKAKRRMTLSLAGLGWLDESEVEDIQATPPPERKSLLENLELRTEQLLDTPPADEQEVNSGTSRTAAMTPQADTTPAQGEQETVREAIPAMTPAPDTTPTEAPEPAPQAPVTGATVDEPATPTTVIPETVQPVRCAHPKAALTATEQGIVCQLCDQVIAERPEAVQPKPPAPAPTPLVDRGEDLFETGFKAEQAQPTVPTLPEPTPVQWRGTVTDPFNLAVAEEGCRFVVQLDPHDGMPGGKVQVMTSYDLIPDGLDAGQHVILEGRLEMVPWPDDPNKPPYRRIHATRLEQGG